MYNDKKEESREKKLQNQVSEGINCLSFSPSEFCKEMARDHRALQADFTHLCIEWIRTAAKQYEDKNYDGRNEYECKLAKNIVDTMKF